MPGAKTKMKRRRMGSFEYGSGQIQTTTNRQTETKDSHSAAFQLHEKRKEPGIRDGQLLLPWEEPQGDSSQAFSAVASPDSNSSLNVELTAPVTAEPVIDRCTPLLPRPTETS